jgi:hypothetical protein
MLSDVSRTESVDIFMEASESVHEEPSMINTKLASKLHYNINFSPICEVNYDFVQYACASVAFCAVCLCIYCILCGMPVHLLHCVQYASAAIQMKTLCCFLYWFNSL